MHLKLNILKYKLKSIILDMEEYMVYSINEMESVFIMNSKIFGDSIFFDESIVKFKFNNINVELNIEDCELEEIEPSELLLRAEKIFEIKDNIYEVVSDKLLETKNKYWLDGEIPITREEFIKKLDVYYIIVEIDKIYVEINDNDLFDGHHINCTLDNDYIVTRVDI